MYARRSIKSSVSVPLIQVQCKGPNGSGPEWLPLKQDWSNRWCTLPDRFTEEFSQRIYDFKRETAMWMQELAWLLLNDMNFEAAQSSYTMIRSPYLEYSNYPRFIKSHLPAQLLPPQFWKKGCKIIYLARNPKDVVVSSFHFLTGLDFWRGSLDEFVDDFVADKMAFTSYWAHVIDFYRMRNEENVFFVTYEEMSRNLKDVVLRLSRFLDCKELSESEMDKLLTHLNFKNMKGRKFGNSTGLLSTLRKTKDDFNFMRRGIVGSYKDELSPENKDKIDKLTERFLEEYGVTESEIFGSIK
ncbi:sulfotransferase 1B1-like [Drosophila gunungcola]|uniref:sulfotransferase 1B1-like n=2 Tax=Drosophila gunungcola TaxID=103775 RepID=UPI0022E665F4|nr:sulfotransferase 1B1-like [Drosophila gunungcola]